jgi:hypothetical protein
MKARIVLTAFWIIVLGVFLLLPAASGQANPLASLQATTFVNLPLIFKNATSGGGGGGGDTFGNIQGYIYNASLQDKPGVPRATVCLSLTPTKCVESNDTDNVGWYSFQNVPVGSYNITIQQAEYYTLISPVQIVTDQTVEYDFGLIKLLVSGDIEMRITVEWLGSEHWPGSDCSPDYPVGCPTDLDAHIWASFAGGDQHHYQCPDPGNSSDCRKYIGDCNAGSAVCIELFSFNGPGPETAAIRKITDAGSSFYYGVQNYYQDRTGVPDINGTSAVVRVYRLDGTSLVYYANGAPAGNGDLWYVFSMNAQREITFHNCITAIPEDPDPTDSRIPLPACDAQ